MPIKNNNKKPKANPAPQNLALETRGALSLLTYACNGQAWLMKIKLGTTPILMTATLFVLQD